MHDRSDIHAHDAIRLRPLTAVEKRADVLPLQREAGNRAVGELAEEAPSVQVPTSGGRALEPSVRSFMEARLGANFGAVRIHTDSAAAASAHTLQASAYTSGEHVVFGAGAYKPDTADGRHRIAHELTHVVQQRSGPVDGTPIGGGLALSHPDDRFERAADRTAHEALRESDQEHA